MPWRVISPFGTDRDPAADPNEFQFAPLGNFEFTPSGSPAAVVPPQETSELTLGNAFLPVPITDREWPLAEPQDAQQSDPIPGSTSSSSGLTIRLVYDAAALAAPASFRAGIQQAADILMTAFSDPITINLTIDYSGTGGGASAGPNHGLFVSYSTVRNDLINSASPGDHTFDALPNVTSIQGQSQVAVWNAELKLFGLMGANDTTTDDGGAKFSTDISPNLLVGVALHELTHAMGRIPYGPQPDIFDLFRFTSAGTRLFQGGATAPAAYFSLDGGNTKLADYGQTSDASDFLNGGVQGRSDAFNEFYNSGTLQQLTAIDLKQMVAAGFHLNSGTAGSVAISDVSITEGDSGTNLATFTVTRTGGTAAFSLNFTTADGTATLADGDYVAASGSLSFGTNVNTQTISVTINGDTRYEPDESFFVNLSGSGATISDSSGLGTILNDDPQVGSVAINDASISEGNSGTKVATFTVTRTGGTAAFGLNFATADGTATLANADYVGSSGTLNFGANVNTQTISVTINGDTKYEADETFFVNLSSATNGATIADNLGTATILNDDLGIFAPPTHELSAFTVGTGGWSSDNLYPRLLADVNGDGLGDIVGFGPGGVNVSLGTGSGHFAQPTFELANFGPAAGGWSSDDRYPRELADVNGDHMADIVGFGEAGVFVALATGGGHFAQLSFELSNFGPSAGGWSSENRYPREVADVNGDGKADIVGFGEAGVFVALATGGGHFAQPTFELPNFGPSAGGWSSDDRYPRMLADVNGDHMADIVGFGEAGVFVALATGGGHFAQLSFELSNFGPSAGGWSSDNQYPRLVADVNGDHMADVVGFGTAGAFLALASGGGHFKQPSFELNNFGYAAGGWASNDLYPRVVGDVTGDGSADIVGFAQSGVDVALAHTFLLI